MPDLDPSTVRRAVAAAVGLAALLLLVNIGLTAVVSRRSKAIREGLEGLRGTTADLRRTPEINRTLEHMTRSLQAIRRGEGG
jgi:hypothetical protein